ncbi:efflux RND transporter permease subunit [Shewanella baltica]|uniref:efflux RND transporter permease subunit n=1 Tax=Shewanella baltica TaxID=62322 RepID=UPI00321871B5
MKFTDYFIARPILAVVISALIVLAGLYATTKLPIRQYPQLESATISVNTTYPGASADLMRGFVTQPISQALASVSDVDFISSISNQNQSTVTVRMRLNSDASKAMTDVVTKVNAVRYKLPQEAFDPVIELTNGESTAVAYVGFSSDSLSIPQLTDYLSREVEPLFSQIEGVSKVQNFGGQDMAIRIWLNNDQLLARNVTATEVLTALKRNNIQSAPGTIKSAYVMANIRVNTDITSIEDFNSLVIRDDVNGLVRFQDIGTVEYGGTSSDTSALMNGKPAVHIGLFPTPKGNPLVIVAEIKRLIPKIEAKLPPGVQVDLAFETARFIDASINEVIKTLIEAIIIVMVVILLCLGSLRSVLIPIMTIPLSMLGAAALMMAFGFSINLLTLLAMILAIGLVVDDAIVVVENIHRYIEEGLTPLQAAVKGAREVASPVVAMTLTLVAVYAPIALIEGLTGALFKEFALTLASAVVVSGVVALVLSPVMSAMLLKPHSHTTLLSKCPDFLFTRLTTRYESVLQKLLKRRWIVYSFALVIFMSLILLFKLPTSELAPIEDQANILTAIKAPENANLNYAETFNRELDEIYMSIPETTSTWIINGNDGPANSFGGINLSTWNDRERGASLIQGELQAKVNEVEGSSIFAFQLSPLPGSTGGLPVQLVLQSTGENTALYRVMEELKQKARQSGLFAVVDSDLAFNKPVINITLNKIKANNLGIDMAEVSDTLSVLVGENYINRISIEGRAYDVIPQLKASQRQSSIDINSYYVRAKSGDLVPLSLIANIETVVDANRLTQFNQQNSATLQAILNSGVSMGEAVSFLESEVATLPAIYSHDWQSETRQFKQEGSTLLFAFASAMLVIYLVLAAQYGSFIDPLIVLITVPLSLFGALLPMALGYASFNIYTQIGLITLIGLISKHGILIVEFANELQANKKCSALDAVLQSASVRLRPILMTTAAMTFGLIPLLFADGAGANSRFALGVVIVCGMVIGTLFTLFILPVFYILIANIRAAYSTKKVSITRSVNSPLEQQ